MGESQVMICESNNLNDYLQETSEIDFSDPLIKEHAAKLFNSSQTDIEKAKIAFEFVRDEVSHSWDIQSSKITCNASEVLHEREGICYAKSNLLAAFLRSQSIPAGFCYQRLLLFDTPEKGYSLHALNAVYLAKLGKWIRLDARGNKEGVDAQFSLDEEKLAFVVREELDEKDYPVIYVNPNPETVSTLAAHTDTLEMYIHHLPDSI
ncbi:transglutaminase-like domain-containing protein [Sporosarcina cascadiensis]|uniref:transglutaminase-like domain-containing protein n=1 Tax=Sporosarcina cascadiensis TaxID=2660747 RepID=UPI001E3DD1A7|nr:transglutaminase family protein [Sporosarcina cascadiensis]